MESLTKSDFKNYLNELTIVDNVAHDELGDVCNVYQNESKCVFNTAFYNGDEFELNEAQKTKIVALIEEDILLNQSDAFEEMNAFEFYTNIYN